jgi:hypothetical protein
MVRLVRLRAVQAVPLIRESGLGTRCLTPPHPGIRSLESGFHISVARRLYLRVPRDAGAKAPALRAFEKRNNWAFARGGAGPGCGKTVDMTCKPCGRPSTEKNNVP